MNQCVIIVEPGKVEVDSCPMPQRKAGEVLLKMQYGGICGSDLNTYRGLSPYVSYPRVPGHEISAMVVEADKNEAGIKEGMLVTANPYFNCGCCYSCRKGRVNCCSSNQTMGVQREGAFYSYFTLPIERIYDGQGLDAKTLALVEPFCISYHGVKKAQPKTGETVLVVGAGTIGLLAALSASQMGAEVTVCDISASKLEKSYGFGAKNTLLNQSPAQFKEQVEQYTHGNGYDVTIEAVGLPETFQNCVDAAAFGGRMVQIGVSKNNADFFFTDIQRKELQITGSRNALKQDFMQVMELIKNGSANPMALVSGQFGFEQAPEAFETLDKNSSEILKVLLKF